MNGVANGVDILWIILIIIQGMTHHSIDQIPLLRIKQIADGGESFRHDGSAKEENNDGKNDQQVIHLQSLRCTILVVNDEKIVVHWMSQEQR